MARRVRATAPFRATPEPRSQVQLDEVARPVVGGAEDGPVSLAGGAFLPLPGGPVSDQVTRLLDDLDELLPLGADSGVRWFDLLELREELAPADLP